MTARRRFYKTVDRHRGPRHRAGRPPGEDADEGPAAAADAALAEAVAAEWDGAGAEIQPATMILTKLANTAIDRVGPGRARIEAEVLDYAGSDLVCYRADRPPDLVARQDAAGTRWSTGPARRSTRPSR